MDSAHENLLARFEEFELDLEVKEILKKVKQEWVWENESLGEFAETLKQLEPEKVEAQRRRAEQAAPFHQLCYPQVTCDWFIEDLDYCCPYWRYEFKRPLTPPPAPRPSPDAAHQAYQTPRQTSSAKRRQPRRTHHHDGYHQRRQ